MIFILKNSHLLPKASHDDCRSIYGSPLLDRLICSPDPLCLKLSIEPLVQSLVACSQPAENMLIFFEVTIFLDPTLNNKYIDNLITGMFDQASC